METKSKAEKFWNRFKDVMDVVCFFQIVIRLNDMFHCLPEILGVAFKKTVPSEGKSYVSHRGPTFGWLFFRFTFFFPCAWESTKSPSEERDEAMREMKAGFGSILERAMKERE